MLEDFVVKAGQGDYRVEQCGTIRELVARWAEENDAVVIIDQNVHRLYAQELQGLEEKFPVYPVPATEDEKTLEGVGRFLTFLQEKGATKSTVILAIGGGILQDIVTLAAQLYYRGLKFHYAPSTLLGMSDSCIGAKCGVNLNHFKNQLGLFNALASVVICRQFLDTLPEDDVRSGYGEIFKLHIIGSRDLWEHFKRAMGEGDWRGPHLEDLIYQSLQVKKKVIEADEYESDLRRILNYGHTFGHALESVTRNSIPHGIAVAWGVDCVNFLSWQRGLLSEADFLDIHEFVVRRFAWQGPVTVTADALIAAARRDKKVQRSRLVLALAAAPGEMRLVPVDFDDRLSAELSEFLDKWSTLRRN